MEKTDSLFKVILLVFVTIFFSGCSEIESSNDVVLPFIDVEKIDDNLEELEELYKKFKEFHIKYEIISNNVSLIEDKYSKNGLVTYSDFTDKELEEYIELIYQAKKLLDEELMWSIQNIDFYKYLEYSDLQISEILETFRESRNDFEETLVTIGNYQANRNRLKNLSITY